MMKKTIIASMVLATSLLATPVMAESNFGVDLESMSLEDLVSLKDAVNEQIAAKGGDNVIGAGIYEVGKDIKAANFKVTPYEASGSMSLELYASEADMTAYNSLFNSFLYYDEKKTSQESVSLNLKEGQILQISGPLIIEDASKAFWAPDSDE